MEETWEEGDILCSLGTPPSQHIRMFANLEDPGSPSPALSSLQWSGSRAEIPGVFLGTNLHHEAT